MQGYLFHFIRTANHCDLQVAPGSKGGTLAPSPHRPRKNTEDPGDRHVIICSTGKAFGGNQERSPRSIILKSERHKDPGTRVHIRNTQMNRSFCLKGLVTDIDGTITDPRRRIHTGAIEILRDLMEKGVYVVLASGNTSCFMDAVSKMIGTPGTYIGENGGIIRNGYGQDITLLGDGVAPRKALCDLVEAYQRKGISIEHYSLPYRFVDVAFARTLPVDEVRGILEHHPVEVLDTGFAIHIHPPGVNKGVAFSEMARAMGLDTRDFLAVGDAENDIELLRRAGIGVAVANAHPQLVLYADHVTERECGDGFIEGVKKYMAYFLER